MTKQVNERELCLELLMEITEKDAYVHTVLRNTLDKYIQLDKRQRSFITRVTEGTIERMIELDACLNRYAKTKTSKMKPLIRNLLRLSAYQILYMDQVPDSAVCNEAVKLAKKRGFVGLKGFVNGVLRTISREARNLEFTSLSEKYSMPQWIVDMWLSDYGAEVTEKILRSFLEPKKLYIRRNMSFCTEKQLLDSLQKDAISCEKAPYIQEAYCISNLDTLYHLEAFRNGYFQVQDLSAMFAALAVMPKEGDQILDVCAAPGGKSLHLADLLHNTGMVEARDLTESKIELIEENIERAGFSNIRAVQWDAKELDATWENRADVVMADLPCSGLGVIGRKMDIKYRMCPEKILELQQLQRSILNTITRYVKPGGMLLYCTCTINKLENEANVQWIQEHFPLELVSLADCKAFSMESDSKEKGYMQLLPGIHSGDGFFIAKFRRKL